MGFAHHTAFFVWFEVGRTEWLRERGLAYRDIEERLGVRLPLVAAQVRYRRPARYDDLIVVETRFRRLSPVRFRFSYVVRQAESGARLAEGETDHAAVDRRGRPRRIPRELEEVLGPW
ncbi:MAG: acyl-CoA thioesterase [Acidobacteria bacterium]|nr:MAG: acyl-CoA thioesterase [Acidobacteriota bacterium]